MSIKIRLMLVDDHVVFREGLANWLRRFSDMDIVAEASNGLEAVDLARSLRPDVVLMDVNMPKMGGLEATEIIMSELPKTCIIGLSIDDAMVIISAMKAAGAVNYFTKDCIQDDLLSAIRGSSITR